MLLKREQIRCLPAVADWREALHRSVAVLEDLGIVEKRYVQAIIEKTEEIGAYYVLTDDAAMPHARPEEGALTEGMAVVRLAEPVVFPGEKSVQILLPFAASDATKHIAILQSIAMLLDEDEKVQALCKAGSEEDLLACANQILNEK